MPGLPTTAYPTAGSTLALARAIIDDAYTTAGQILKATAPMTYQYVNSAYQFLQDELINSGIETFIKEMIISPLTPAANNDPATQVSLSETGYFDGVTNHNPPQLPTDLIVPLKIWERTTGFLGYFAELQEANDGLPSLSQTGSLRFWEWRENDGIYFCGCTQSKDVRIRYDARLQDVAQDTDPILIRGSRNVMAYLTAWQYAITSGDSAVADAVFTAANKMIAQMTTRSARRNQRGSHRRGSSRARGRGMGYGY